MHLCVMRVLLIFFCTLSITGYTQINANIYAGLANYQGDLQTQRFSITPIKPAIGIGLSYQIMPRVAITGATYYMQLEGSDRYSNKKETLLRNLSFKTRILEVQINASYSFFNLSERKVTPYIFAGFAAFHFNPYTTSLTGEKIYLQPLGTEGQGMTQYPNRKEYKLIQMAIPFGGGIKTRVNDRLYLGIEMNLRKLFTDYLDDVSTSYADSALLANARGVIAAVYAYRGDENPGGAPYPAAGTQRGNPKNKDWYYTTAIKFSYNLFATKRNIFGNKHTKTGCPVW